jgi:hypothetical protein
MRLVRRLLHWLELEPRLASSVVGQHLEPQPEELGACAMVEPALKRLTTVFEALPAAAAAAAAAAEAVMTLLTENVVEAVEERGMAADIHVAWEIVQDTTVDTEVRAADERGLDDSRQGNSLADSASADGALTAEAVEGEERHCKGQA